MLSSFRYLFFNQIDSTNTYALKLIDNYELQNKINMLNKTVIIADKQTQGRGRLNRGFYSPQFTGLYMSVIFFPKKRIISPSLITPFAAVAVHRAIKKLCNIETSIKWVNDIYLDSKKVCGILAEGHINNKKGLVDSVVVGFGINLFKSDFPDELKNKAGSIFSDKEFSIDQINTLKKELADEILIQFFDLLKEEDEVCNGSIGNNEKLFNAMNEYREKSIVIGKTVDIYPLINNQENYKAKILDITDNAQLKIQLENGKIHFIDSGEISLSSN